VTIHPTLREILLRVESRPETDKLLFSVATDMRAAMLRSPNPEDGNKIFFQTRAIWDVVNLLDERTDKDRLYAVGSSMVMKRATAYQMQNTLICNSEPDARLLQRDLFDFAGPEVIMFFKKVIQHKVELVKEETPRPPQTGDPNQPGFPGFPGGQPPGPPMGPPMPGGQPGDNQPPVKKEEVTKSRITIGQNEKVVDFKLDLIFDAPSLVRMQTAMKLLICSLRQEVEAAAGDHPWRHDLADAGRKLGEVGLQRPANVYQAFEKVTPGSFPKGAFDRGFTTKRAEKEPSNRVSWMAGLLPYLGHNTLYNHINFDKSWRDEDNWLAARSLVPQFLDPTYPVFSRYVGYPGMPLEAAATHYVGIAGVGIDSADYAAGDPKLLGKLGVFGYDRSTSLETIKQGRGLSNTVLMIRVPYDGTAGVTPWMAGGGSTVRHVPDKNSLEPFLSTEANGTRGTYVLMCDGSVRYLKAGVSDVVFKAMCTVDGPTPPEFNLDDGELIKVEPRPKPEVVKKNTLPPGWNVHHSAEGNFSVALPPGSLVNLNQVDPIPGLGDRTIKGFKAITESKQSFSAFYFDLPDNVKKQSLNQQIHQVATAFKKELNISDPKRELKIAMGKATGLEVEATDKEGGSIFRVYVLQQRAYVVMARGPNFSASAPETQTFLVSFKLKTN
jgi:hypothetical protein